LMWAALAHVATLLPLRDAPTANAITVLHRHWTNVRAEVGERECEGPVRRGKVPLCPKANPLHRKAERALQGFS